MSKSIPYLATLAAAAVFTQLIDEGWKYIICSLLMFAVVVYTEHATSQRVKNEELRHDLTQEDS